jgi:hypothetical protein
MCGGPRRRQRAQREYLRPKGTISTERWNDEEGGHAVARRLTLRGVLTGKGQVTLGLETQRGRYARGRIKGLADQPKGAP